MRSVEFDALSEDDKRTLNALLDVLEQFRLMRGTVPVHLVSAFLRVALHEGKSTRQYADDSGVSPSVMSRHLLDVGPKLRTGDEGLGLVQAKQAPENLRRNEMVLSPKGVALARRIARRLRGGPQ